MANRLARETSPYLLQHQNNPVDWYPWGEEALERARREDKPILLSVGYSACHWCHVMEHESFENVRTANLMNTHFVCVKVDREERPDLDQIYQNVAQIFTHGGGWPLTVFLAPDLRPFFGGTYFPPEDRYGRPGFPRLLEALAVAWRDDRQSVLHNAEKVVEAIRKMESLEPSATEVRPDLRGAMEQLLSGVDWTNGGTIGAPKFPSPMTWSFLWRAGLAYGSDEPLAAVRLTLVRMACGGIYDQLGGGFSRYSVDETWSVPHFEKMLYDNGLLLKLYAEVLLTAEGLPAFEKRLFTRVLEQTVEYCLREMRAPSGLFYAAQDADSEGEEGKFFAWGPGELPAELEPVLGVTKAGNFEHGKTVLHLAGDPALALERVLTDLAPAVRAAFELREKRVRPGLDDKVLLGWNGLTISGLVWASEALEREGRCEIAERARSAAIRAFEAVAALGPRLPATIQRGEPRGNGFLDDYAFLAQAALDVDRLRGDGQGLAQSRAWTQEILARFAAEDGMGFYFTSSDHERLIERPRTVHDQAIPSGVAVTLQVLQALGEMAEDPAERERLLGVARAQLTRLGARLERSPYGMSELATATLLEELSPVTWTGSDQGPAFEHAFVFRKPGSGEPQICHRGTCRRGTRDARQGLVRSRA